MTDNPLYRIIVHVETREECGEPRAEWDAHRHRCIVLQSAVDPETKDKFSRDDLRAAFHWCAGVLARLALRLHEDIDVEYRYNRPGTHRCYRDPDGYSEHCGWGFEEGVTNPRWAVDEWHVVPMVWLNVPTEHADRWADAFRRRLAEILADDTTPLDPQLDHQQVVLTEPTTQPRKASTS